MEKSNPLDHSSIWLYHSGGRHSILYVKKYISISEIPEI